MRSRSGAHAVGTRLVRPARPLRPHVLISSRAVGEHVRQPYIVSHYRQPLMNGSLSIATMRGLLTLHNETANVWSHLLGFGWALWRLVTVQAAARGSPYSRTSAGVFHLSAMAMLMASTVAHLLGPILPQKPSERLWRIDHACICITIGGSYVPGLLYGFRCHPLARNTYAVFACAGLAASFYLTLFSRLSADGRDWLRIIALCTTVLFGLAPTGHYCLFATAEDFHVMVPGLLGMFAAYGAGLFVFLRAVPERLAPGAFALCSSHTLWHVCIVAALVSWDYSVDQMLGRDWACDLPTAGI